MELDTNADRNSSERIHEKPTADNDLGPKSTDLNDDWRLDRDCSSLASVADNNDDVITDESNDEQPEDDNEEAGKDSLGSDESDFDNVQSCGDEFVYDIFNLKYDDEDEDPLADCPDHPIDGDEDEDFSEFDRPGPKSMKASTHLLSELKARTLLENAILIPVADDLPSNCDGDEHEYFEDAYDDTTEELPAEADEYVQDEEITTDDRIVTSDQQYTEHVQAELLPELNSEVETKEPEISSPAKKSRNDSSSDEEYLPNDVYFGTPDSPHSGSKSRRIDAGTNGVRNRQRTAKGQRADSADSVSSDEFIVKGRRPARGGKSALSRELRKARKSSSRFKDKSRHIPNEIYFDAKVPLHILYSYASDSSEENLGAFPTLPSLAERSAKPSNGRGRSKSKPGRKPIAPANKKDDQRLKHMKRCFRAAGFQYSRLKELFNDGDSTLQRAEKILALLRENGITDEPTVENCRAMRKEIVAREEVRELDPSLIIQAEGRTRRSVAAQSARRT